jgi:uncharacterized protein (TIGR03437 family)
LPGVLGAIFPDQASSLMTPIQVYVGGEFTPSGEPGTLADVLYAGAAPLEFAGIDQINVRIPVGAGTGSAVLVWVADSLATGTTIAVK